MLAKVLILVVFAAILYTLASSFYFLVTDKGDSTRTVWRLTWRIGLSLALFLSLWAAYKLGWIEPSSGGPVLYGAPAAEAPAGD